MVNTPTMPANRLMTDREYRVTVHLPTIAYNVTSLDTDLSPPLTVWRGSVLLLRGLNLPSFLHLKTLLMFLPCTYVKIITISENLLPHLKNDLCSNKSI